MSINRQVSPKSSILRRFWDAVRHAPQRALIAAVRAYQILLSPRLGARCRFHPSCSVYGLEALRVHGAFKGTLLAIGRVGRCHPWNKGGVNPIPEPGSWRSPVNPDGTPRTSEFNVGSPVTARPQLSAKPQVRPNEHGART